MIDSKKINIMNMILVKGEKMSYIRIGSERKYFKGESEAYVYLSSIGVTDYIEYSNHDDVCEVICRMVEIASDKDYAERIASYLDNNIPATSDIDEE